MIKNKHLLLFSFFIIFIFLIADSAFASETGLSFTSLGGYVGYIWTTVMGIAGTIATISFAVGAVGYIMSGDNPELAGSSKDRMKGAILGAALLLASWLIMNTINPQLVSLPTINSLPQENVSTPIQPGVYFYNGSGCPSTENATPHTSSQGPIESPYTGTIKSIKIVQDVEPYGTYNYGVIFHEVADLKRGGDCGVPIIGNGSCQSVNISNASAVDIFEIDSLARPHGEGATFYSEPEGYTRVSDAGFLNIPGKSITSPSAGGTPYNLDPSTLCFDYTDINADPTYECKCSDSTCGDYNLACSQGTPLEGVTCSQYACETFQDCPGSVELDRGYLIAFYSQDSSNSNALYCQTFTDNSINELDNLTVQPVTHPGNPELQSIYIIPIVD